MPIKALVAGPSQSDIMAGRLRAQVEARAPRKTSEPTADQERDKPVTKAKVGQRSGAERGLGGE